MARILVVEDNAALADMLVRMLQGVGHCASVVGDGAAALRWLEQQASSPDLVLSDLNMPFVSGEELIVRLRSNPRFVSTPVIVVTGVDAHAVAHLCQGVVHKPFDIAELSDMIARALDGSAAS